MAGRIFAALLLFATIAVAAGCKRASPLPPNVSRLIAELRSPDLRRRQDAAVALGKVHPMPPEAIEALAAAVENRRSGANKDKLGLREAVRHPGQNSFSNGALEFAFSIWNANDPECCPTGGQVVGTYKIIKEMGASSGGGCSSPNLVQSSGANRDAGADDHVEDGRRHRRT